MNIVSLMCVGEGQPLFCEATSKDTGSIFAIVSEVNVKNSHIPV